jgi:choline dehydrogenase-like flavoprotein
MRTPGYHVPLVPTHLTCEVVVVGSGAGGSAAAAQLAAAGLDVVVLEMGERSLPSDFTQREEEMIPRLFQEAGARTTTDGAITVLQGKGVGGSTLHNLNLCKRVPDALLARWAEDNGLVDLPGQLATAYDAMEATLGVHPVPGDRVNRNNQLFQQGCAALGWEAGPLHHNRQGCIGSGFCELGCAYDAKMNAARVLLPAAVANGARVLSQVRVRRVLHRFGHATGVQGVGKEGVPVRVDAQAVVLAASATGSPALLLASGLHDRYRQVGAGLHLHPGASVGAWFSHPVRGWEGIPQSWECTEFLDPTDPEKRCWLLPVFGHPVGAASSLPGFGTDHNKWMSRYTHLAAASAMLHDHTSGRVLATREGAPRIRYRLSREDARHLSRGLSATAEILLAAGAKEVLMPQENGLVVTRPSEARAAADKPIRSHAPTLVAVHPMGGLRMGTDPRRSATDPVGRLHTAQGVWVADGSLVPTSTGGPPQLTIYALGHLVGRACAQELGGKLA